MSRFQATVTVAIFSLPGISAGEWYRIQGDSPTTIRIHADGQSLKVPVRKVHLPVSALVLRRDTERSGWYWVEVTLPETRDSDGHMLVIGGRVAGQVPEPGQVYTRTNKWAIGFISLEQARRCFDYLRTLHRIDTEHARDATKA